MKHTYQIVLSTAFAAVALSASAQLVEVRDGSGNVLNGTNVQVVEAVGDAGQIMGFSAAVENISGAQHTVNVKRYEVNVPHGTGNYFCWDLCYGERNAGVSPLWIGADPIPMAPGFIANGFHAYYKPYEFLGQAVFRYVWYDMDNTNDSVYVDITFNATPAGVAERTSPVLGFDAFPNPVVGGDLTLNYELANITADTRLVVYNVLGERKLVKAVKAARGKVVLGEGELGSGVWFAVLERDGRAMATKRVTVVR
jgi:hypothetical protein